MTEQPPEHVQAWQLALGCEVRQVADCPSLVAHPIGDHSGHMTWRYQTRTTRAYVEMKAIPDRDSGDYFKAMVLAVLNGSKTLYFAPNWPMKGTYEVLIGDYRETKPDQEVVGHGPDQVSALIAAISASKGGEK